MAKRADHRSATALEGAELVEEPVQGRDLRRIPEQVTPILDRSVHRLGVIDTLVVSLRATMWRRRSRH